MATQQAPQYITVPAGSDLSTKQFYFMNISAGKLAVASAGGRVVGTLTNKPDAAGKAGSLQFGGAGKVLAAGTISAGGAIASDASGKAVAAAGTDLVAGIALEDMASGGIYSYLCTNTAAIAVATGEETKTSGALNVDIPISYLSVTGTVAFTLADGTNVGARKILECTVAATTPIGTLTINDAYLTESTTHVFNTVGQRLVLEWRTGGWKVVEKRRTGSVTPVVGTTVLTGNDMVETYNLSITNTVTSATTMGIPDGQLEGEIIWIRCTTAGGSPVGVIDGTYKLLSGVAATHAAVNATTDYEQLRWDGAAWQEQITNSVTLS